MKCGQDRDDVTDHATISRPSGYSLEDRTTGETIGGNFKVHIYFEIAFHGEVMPVYLCPACSLEEISNIQPERIMFLEAK